MTKVYIVTRVGWEYNDENYFRADAGGTDLTDFRAYRSYDKAKKFCDDKNLEAFKEFADDIGNYKDYNDTLDEMINPLKEFDFLNVCEVMNIDPKTSVAHVWGDPDVEGNHFKDLTDAQLKAIIPLLVITFYEISEAEIEDE